LNRKRRRALKLRRTVHIFALRAGYVRFETPGRHEHRSESRPFGDLTRVLTNYGFFETRRIRVVENGKVNNTVEVSARG